MSGTKLLTLLDIDEEVCQDQDGVNRFRVEYHIMYNKLTLSMITAVLTLFTSSQLFVPRSGFSTQKLLGECTCTQPFLMFSKIFKTSRGYGPSSFLVLCSQLLDRGEPIMPASK